MKIISFLLFGIFLFAVPAFGQMGIITTDSKLRALEKEGKYDEAIVEINERIKIQPNNGELYLRRAEFLKLQNKLDEAIEDISEGIRVNPDNPTFYIARAEYYNLAKNSNAVLRDVQIAASLAPNKGGILNVAAQELKRGEQYKETINLADFYIARNASDDEASNQIKSLAYKIRGENKFALKDYAGALEDSIAAINYVSFTGDSEKDFGVRITFNNLIRSEVILQTTQKYLENDENIFNYYNQLFDALKIKTEISVNQEIQESIKRDQILPRKPKSETSLTFYPPAMRLEQLMIDCALLYVEKGQTAEGTELFERIVNLNLPNKWSRYSHRADLYIKLKKYQAAIDDLTFVISDKEGLSPRHPTYVLYLNKRGRLYEAVNQFDKAVADYEAMKTIDPRNETAANAMILKARQKQIENANQPK